MDAPSRPSLIFAEEACAAQLRAVLPGSHLCVKSRAEIVYALKRRPAIAFVDVARLAQVEIDLADVPTIGILHGDTLGDALRALGSFTWLSDLISTSMLPTPLARPHLAMLLDRIAQGPESNPLAASAVGRAALLRRSARREARFDRMREFFSEKQLSTRLASSIVDVAEELVTNALYDAPAEAGYFRGPVSRTEDVELPPEHACEISYGLEEGSAFVRVRDPFGALTRGRLLAVLNRCNSTCVSLDESRGGAGLGLWRVFSSASTIAVTVIPGRLTDVLVRVEAKRGRAAPRQLLGLHLFVPSEQTLDGARGRFAADHDDDLMDESFTAMQVA